MRPNGWTGCVGISKLRATPSCSGLTVGWRNRVTRSTLRVTFGAVAWVRAVTRSTGQRSVAVAPCKRDEYRDFVANRLTAYFRSIKCRQDQWALARLARPSRPIVLRTHERRVLPEKTNGSGRTGDGTTRTVSGNGFAAIGENKPIGPRGSSIPAGTPSQGRLGVERPACDAREDEADGARGLPVKS